MQTYLFDFSTTKADPEIYKMAAARLGKSVALLRQAGFTQLMTFSKDGFVPYAI